MAVNPYAAPQSRVADVAEAAPDGTFVRTGHAVPWGNAWNWFISARGIFNANKVAWIVIFVAFALIMVALHHVPVIGMILMYLLMPILYGGLMQGCEAARKGGDITVAHLVLGFKNDSGKLALVGLASVVMFLAVIGVIYALFGIDIARATLGVKSTPEQLQAMGIQYSLASLVALGLTLPLYMAIWFAPALVSLNGFGPGEALKASFAGCLKNVIPFFVYGVALIVLAIIATIPILLGWLVLGPVLLASMYTAYRDIFYEA